MLSGSIKNAALATLLLAGMALAQTPNLDTNIKGSRPPYAGVDSGTTNAYVVTTSGPLGPTIRTLSRFYFLAANANTGASTLNVDGTGALAIKEWSSGSLVPLVAGDISVNQWVEVMYDGTEYQMISAAGTGTGASASSTYRTCVMIFGADNGSTLVNADIGPQGRQCFVPYNATVQEIEVTADAGTPNVMLAVNHAGSLSNLLSSVLTTASSGGIACSNAGGTLGFDGATTCTGTLQNTSIAQGDYVEAVSGSASTAKRLSVFITWTQPGVGTGGTVTSVGISFPSGFTCGSPVVSAGTLSCTWSVAGADRVLLSTAANTAGFSAAIGGCGDSTHALGYDPITHTFPCQLLAGGSSGAGVKVNGSAIAGTNANFSDSTPSPSSNYVNVEFQKDATTPDTNISGQVPAATTSVLGVVKAITCTNQFIRSITSGTGVEVCASVANADLANPSTTVNGQTCTLGSSCTVTAGGTSATEIPVSASISNVGLQFWISADCITLTDASTCTTPSNGSTFKVWYDRSGYGRNAYRTAGTLTFNTSQINGQPAVTPTSSPNIHVQGEFWSGAITVFAVFKNTTGGKAAILSTNSSFYWNSGGGFKELSTDISGTSNLGTGTAALDSNWHQANVSCDQNSNPVYRLDRASDTTISGAACALDNSNAAFYYLLSNVNSEFFGGQVAEIIMYNRVLSSTETTTVETYLNGKYGL